jgi:uncharacterized linocin/CFP29 family protein
MQLYDLCLNAKKPTIAGGFVLTTRGGDFELDSGQDISTGYLSHNATTVELYLQESLTFRSLTSEAAVALAPQGKQGRLFPAR